MVDCRAEMAHQPNGAEPPAPPPEPSPHAPLPHPPPPHATPPAVRAATPHTTNSLTSYTGAAMNPVNVGGVPNMAAYTMGGGCAPYACAKGMVWCGPTPSPPPHAPLPLPLPLQLPPPHHVNPHVYKSVQPNGADLPMNDIPTLRYYYNLGVECMWAAYGPPPPPPRHYSPRDIAQEMQQMSIQERGVNHNASGDQNHKNHKPPPPDNKLPVAGQGKGPGQRPLVGPRFKRGNNQEGNQNSNHGVPNKGHNNNIPNKGPNNRRNSYQESRGYGEGECAEPPVLALPYIPYPPPMYPVPYYPLDSDPAMMGMMGGMGYVGYEEGAEFVQPYYPPHYPHPHAHPHHVDHK